MITDIVILIVGVIVGWQVPQPPWAKWAVAKVKVWFKRAVDDSDSAGA